MKIWIITAMKEEADHIIKLYDLTPKTSLQNIHIFEREDIVLILAGIWKIQASIGAAYLCLNYEIGYLINIGIAWSLIGENAKIGDVFMVNTIYQHDMYLPFDWEHLNYAKKEIIIPDHWIDFSNHVIKFSIINNGKCLTWDQFIDDQAVVNSLSEKYNADVIEMEAFAIASVAREFNMLDKCIFIKAISDWANNESIDAHMWNLDFAMKNSILALDIIIKNNLNKQ